MKAKYKKRTLQFEQKAQWVKLWYSLSSAGRLVGWDINVPFLHKNRLYRGQALG